MGEGSVVASELAAKDFGGSVIGKKIEVISADMQSKPDLAVQLATEWYDQDGVDVIVDVPASAAAITIQRMAYEKHKLFLGHRGGHHRPDGQGLHADRHSLGPRYRGRFARARQRAGAGGRKELVLHHARLRGRQVARRQRQGIMVEKSGGKLLGTVYHQTNITDYATYLLQAQQSGADAIAVGSIGLDLSTLLKQAVEFGILPNSKQKLTSFLLALSDVNAVGLPTTAGVYVLSDFYWDQNDQTRAFSKSFFAIRNKEPNFTQAANYSGLLAYFNAVKEAGTDDPEKVVAKMREHPMDKFGEKAVLRPDGRVVSDVQLYQVKSQAESKYPWDYMKLVRTIPGDQVFPSMAEEDCPLVKK